MQINYDKYRSYFGSVKSNKTVEMLQLIVSYAISYGCTEKQIAYILATAYHETAFDFIPKYEFGKAEYFIKKYWHNSKVARWLGNDDAKDAFECRGRGLVQITGENNYIKFGIRDNPDKALEPQKATEILVNGMVKGMFTGQQLGFYINSKSTDFLNARRVVNGMDKAATIRDYAVKFVDILEP